MLPSLALRTKEMRQLLPEQGLPEDYSPERAFSAATRLDAPNPIICGENLWPSRQWSSLLAGRFRAIAETLKC